MTMVYLTKLGTVIQYVTISFKLILRTKHIIVFSTMYGMSFKILSAKQYQKC